MPSKNNLKNLDWSFMFYYSCFPFESSHEMAIWCHPIYKFLNKLDLICKLFKRKLAIIWIAIWNWRINPITNGNHCSRGTAIDCSFKNIPAKHLRYFCLSQINAVRNSSQYFLPPRNSAVLERKIGNWFRNHVISIVYKHWRKLQIKKHQPKWEQRRLFLYLPQERGN